MQMLEILSDLQMYADKIIDWKNTERNYFISTDCGILLWVPPTVKERGEKIHFQVVLTSIIVSFTFLQKFSLLKYVWNLYDKYISMWS